MWIKAANGSYFITDFIFIKEYNASEGVCYSVDAVPRKGGYSVHIKGPFRSKEEAQKVMDFMMIEWENRTDGVCIYV